PQGTQGEAYSFTPSVGGGMGARNFSVSNQSALTVLGLNFNPTTGAISGMPTAGSWSGNIIVTDLTGSKSLATNIVVAHPALTLSYAQPSYFFTV
ncbi:putative Ig domain-containing protein, partial [Stenotrophomonas maltophilia]|uniref:putative Ig domain-containing protein n=1 Tax=Stenotrophomonas maltophilia TaxID=40324 RepID=UPI0013DC4778